VDLNKNILLISANAYTTPYPVYPLGISYLCTYLRKNLPQYNYSIFDFNRNSLSDLGSQLLREKYDFICLSIRNIDDINIYEKNSFIAWYKQIIEVIKVNSAAGIIIGGPGFSIFPELFFETLNVDYGIKGEGEESLVKLLRCLEEKEDLNHIDGLVYRTDNSEIKVNQRNSYINSLELSFDNDLVDFYWSRSGMLNIQTKRGCPYNCIYCSYPVIEGSKIRTLNPDLIVETLQDLYFKKGITYVFFTDSVFNIANDYNISLAKKIIDSGVKVSWGAYFSPHNIDRESLILFKKAGLTHIEFGTESFSDQQLRNYRKHFKFREVLEISEISSDLGIFFAHFLILGGYGETEKSLDETFENSKKIPRSVYFPYIGMRIYPNTALCKIALKEGLINSVTDLLNPVYYLSKDINTDSLKDRAFATGKKWIFPDFDDNGLMEKFRARKIRGPLWEYLRY
jgi:radical SAM superfamily enzyme YgiQ (UPF0313 family)